jgi:hypothetical protein
MMRKNRRGDLMNNMVGIIVALIGILIFAYALVQLYNVNVNQEKENAKNTLNSITVKIDALEDGEENTFAIQGVEDWTLVGFDKEGTRPEKCFFNSCLCICETVDHDFSLNHYSEQCQSKGICSALEFDEVNTFSYSLYSDGRISDMPIWRAIIKLRFSRLFEFSIHKSEDVLNVSAVVPAEPIEEVEFPSVPEGQPLF